MELTQVIVYRNPLEAMFWNSMMNGSGVLVFLTVIGLGVSFVLLYKIAEYALGFTKIDWKKRQSYSMRFSTVAVCIMTVLLLMRHGIL